MTIAENILAIKKTLPESVNLVAVSKFHPVEAIEEAYQGGQRIFGESKAQELQKKAVILPKDIEWHFIGHLQTNKVKYIAPFVSLIHSMDSVKLLEEVNKQEQKHSRVVPCLLQIHIAEEETKFGLDMEECRNLLSSTAFGNFSNIAVHGLMGMATFTDNEEQIRKEFRQLRTFFNDIKKQFFLNNDNFNILSMGMSDDYPVAVEEGSTMIRVGSRIFGERHY
ncbi:MAG: YggS family pyridoxal phosphate-dependent enzyme [Candidatus Azobacteroides sp.]|nr:YggS family pyridoxal phosphate-dependent enzyme [Candidatus Azobacteroides sp.]